MPETISASAVPGVWFRVHLCARPLMMARRWSPFIGAQARIVEDGWEGATSKDDAPIDNLRLEPGKPFYGPVLGAEWPPERTSMNIGVTFH